MPAEFSEKSMRPTELVFFFFFFFFFENFVVGANGISINKKKKKNL